MREMKTSQLSRRELLLGLGASIVGVSMTTNAVSGKANDSQRPNIVMIAVDDLRPELGCYGNNQIVSPHIDRLAGSGTVFNNCFCQVPVCGASRASLLTGVRPTPTRFVGFDTWADRDLPGHLSLPRYFKEHGYHTISNGKIYHHRTDDMAGWSEEPWRPNAGYGRGYLTDENIEIAKLDSRGAGPAFESADVPDNAYADGKIADKTIEDLRRLHTGDQPFFIAVGFLKPHLPFNAPKRFWDLYDRDAIRMADNPYRPKDAPDAAMHNWGELRQYHGIPAQGPVSDELARILKHGYYACVSYTDAQIGRIMDELDRLGLRENTIVILWGDHGWNLQEHGLWCKHCNFQTSLRAPLIVSAPGFTKAQMTNELTEFVDIYPTLCELSGLPIPAHTEGSSLAPLLKDPNRPWKTAIFSRYMRGDSIKTKQYVYTEWRDKQGNRTATMLYDVLTDPDENINLSLRPEYQPLVDRLSRMLADGWRNALPE